MYQKKGQQITLTGVRLKGPIDSLMRIVYLYITKKAHCPNLIRYQLTAFPMMLKSWHKSKTYNTLFDSFNANIWSRQYVHTFTEKITAFTDPQVLLSLGCRWVVAKQLATLRLFCVASAKGLLGQLITKEKVHIGITDICWHRINEFMDSMENHT